jgi:hypothetical protein
VRDHRNRLVELFSHLSDTSSSRRGRFTPPVPATTSAQRTINSPLVGLALLQPELLPQFTFSLDDSEDGGKMAAC